MWSKLLQRVFLSFPHYKHRFHQLLPAGDTPKKIVFVMGCQRSGTSLMMRLFHLDVSTRVYGEFSELSDQDINRIRLNPIETVRDGIYSNRASNIILKPLVESQNALTLLDNFEGSKVLWMYRHYKDVGSSNIKNWGLENGIKDLRPIVADEQDNWRSEHVSQETRELVLKYFSEDMDSYDAVCLIWYSRNILFFDQTLDQNEKVIMCKYDDFVGHPTEMMRYLYKALSLPYPGDGITKQVHQASIGKGSQVQISDEIETLCQNLYDRLDKVYQNFFPSHAG